LSRNFGDLSIRKTRLLAAVGTGPVFKEVKVECPQMFRSPAGVSLHAGLRSARK